MKKPPSAPPATPPLMPRAALLALLTTATGCGGMLKDSGGSASHGTNTGTGTGTKTQNEPPQTAPVLPDKEIIAPQVPPTDGDKNDAPQVAPQIAPQDPPQDVAPQIIPPQVPPQIAPVLPDAPQLGNPDVEEEQTFAPVRAKIESATNAGATAFQSLATLAATCNLSASELTKFLVQTDFYEQLSEAAKTRLATIYQALPAATTAQQALAADINVAAAAGKQVFGSLAALASETDVTTSALTTALASTQVFRLLTDDARAKAKDLINLANQEPSP